MSIITVTDPGYGSPLRVVVRVRAIGSTDAMDAAKREVRAAGYAIKTAGWIKLADERAGTVDEHPTAMDWEVQLIARQKA